MTLLGSLDCYDRAAYRWVAQLRLPVLDKSLKLVSDFANFSKPWFLVTGLLALFGGSRGRRAALTGLAAIGTASLVVNLPMKLAGKRLRPDREGSRVPPQRWVRMPSSTSPVTPRPPRLSQLRLETSSPALRLPLRVAASIVAFPACIQACTTRMTYSSARPWAPWPDG